MFYESYGFSEVFSSTRKRCKLVRLLIWNFASLSGSRCKMQAPPCGARYGFRIFMFVGFIEMYSLKKRNVKEMKYLTEEYQRVSMVPFLGL